MTDADDARGASVRAAAREALRSLEVVEVVIAARLGALAALEAATAAAAGDPAEFGAMLPGEVARLTHAAERLAGEIVELLAALEELVPPEDRGRRAGEPA